MQMLHHRHSRPCDPSDVTSANIPPQVQVRGLQDFLLQRRCHMCIASAQRLSWCSAHSIACTLRHTGVSGWAPGQPASRSRCWQRLGRQQQCPRSSSNTPRASMQEVVTEIHAAPLQTVIYAAGGGIQVTAPAPGSQLSRLQPQPLPWMRPETHGMRPMEDAGVKPNTSAERRGAGAAMAAVSARRLPNTARRPRAVRDGRG